MKINKREAENKDDGTLLHVTRITTKYVQAVVACKSMTKRRPKESTYRKQDSLPSYSDHQN